MLSVLQERVILQESVYARVSYLPPPHVCVREEIQRALGGTPPGDGHGNSQAPLIGQEGRLSSQNVTYPFVGRIWHSGTAVGVKRDRLELSPTSAVAKKEPSEESVAWTSRDSCQSRTVALNTEPQSSRAEEARETVVAREASAWEAIWEPCVLASTRDSDVHLRSGPAGSSKSPSPPMQLTTQDSEEPRLTAHLRECKLQGLGESDNQMQASAASVLLEDCESGVILQACATAMLIQDCRSDTFLAADILACQGCLLGSHSVSTGDMSASQVLHDLTSSEGSSQRESLRLQDQYKSQSKTSVPTAEREDNRRPSTGQQEEGLAGLRTSQSIRMSSVNIRHQSSP